MSSAVRVMEGNGTSANGAVIIGLQIVEGEVLHYTNSSQLSNIQIDTATQLQPHEISLFSVARIDAYISGMSALC